MIERNADRLLRLVGDLLVVARGDAGRLGLVMEETDLGRVAADCAQEAQPAADERGIVITVDAEPLPVTADRARMAQVLDNLVSNALKFTPAGGRLAIRARALAEQAVVEVADTGVGIAQADQAHLFERFYRTAAAQADAVPGTGLGLSIARMIVEAHGGRIEVESAEGRGSTFRFHVPLRVGSRAGAPDIAPAASH